VISAREAKRIFEEGKPVGYMSGRFTFAIIKDPHGQTPVI
jgi:hypothetical protein